MHISHNPSGKTACKQVIVHPLLWPDFWNLRQWVWFLFTSALIVTAWWNEWNECPIQFLVTPRVRSRSCVTRSNCKSMCGTASPPSLLSLWCLTITVSATPWSTPDHYLFNTCMPDHTLILIRLLLSCYAGGTQVCDRVNEERFHQTLTTLNYRLNPA